MGQAVFSIYALVSPYQFTVWVLNIDKCVCPISTQPSIVSPYVSMYKVNMLFAKGRDIAMVDAVLGDTKAAEMMRKSMVLENPGLAIHGCRCRGPYVSTRF